MLDQEHLENFLHVVDLGSLSRAAQRAHVTQPALSRQIKLLEEELGCELFERTGRGMLPTVQGKRLELRARPLLAQLNSLRTEFVDAPVSGPLTFSVTPSVGMAWTAKLVSLFRAKYPEVELRVVVALSGAMGEAIGAGRFDAGVLYTPLFSGRLISAELWQEETHFVCTKSHPLAHRKAVSCRQVLSQELILPSSQYGIRALLEEQARLYGSQVKSSIEVDSVQLAMELVRQGQGTMLLTERALSDIGARKLASVPIRRPSLIRAAELVSSDAALRRPAVRAFWEFVLEQQRCGTILS